MLKWLNAREWLEHERLTGLPTADLAGEALGMLDEAEGSEGVIQTLEYDLDRPDDINVAVMELITLRDAVLEVLAEAGVITHDQGVDEVDVPGLLRMFLPAA